MKEYQSMNQKIRLTQSVQKGGCAAKVAATELRKILKNVEFPPTPAELKIDSGSFDDAAIFQVTPDLSLVQTLDFFTPIVDSPYLFGKIASVNALSDVYAMGGKPKTAMAIFAFPLAQMDNAVAVEVLQGASDVLREAKAALVGGHTIDDDTMKFGLSVTGYVHPQKVWSNAGAKPGDDLLLTKPLGTGTVTAALKRGEVSEEQIQDVLDSMCTINNVIEDLDDTDISSIHAATDITGFGLAGHSLNLANASGVTCVFRLEQLPLFSRAAEFIEKGFLTKAHRTNAEYVKEQIEISEGFPVLEKLIYDPQTSGGLLLAVSPQSSEKILAKIKKRFPFAVKIGSVSERKAKALQFRK
jgi:selenide,water dikinase